MSPIKAMPLLLAAAIPFAMTAGTASAAEKPVILAQATPDKKDDQKHGQGGSQQHGQGSAQPHGSGGGAGSGQPHGAGAGSGNSQPHGAGAGSSTSQPQLHSQGSQTGQGGSLGGAQRGQTGQGSGLGGMQHGQTGQGSGAGGTQHGQTGQGSGAGGTQHGQTGQGSGAGGTQHGQTGQGSGAGGTQHGQTGQGSGAGGTQHGQTGQGSGAGGTQHGQTGQGSGAGGTQHGQTGQGNALGGVQGGTQHTTTTVAPVSQFHTQSTGGDAAKLHEDQVKSHPMQQGLHQEHILRRELSVEERQAKGERDAHGADRLRLIEKQKQMASQEKGQAAVSERLRIQNERFHAISSQRTQTVDGHGQTIIKEPGNRTIVKVGGHAFIQHDEGAKLHIFGGDPQTRRGPNGNSISTIVRHDGVRLEVEVDGYGRPIRRVRYLPDGRRFVLFENRALAIGAGLALGALIISLPPVDVDIPREQYIVDAEDATEDDMYAALQAGPVMPLDHAYSLEEVLASVSLRQRMRSVNIDSINFDFGSWEVAPDQAEMLEPVAAVIRDMVNRNPGEVFLIEGHTDAVGSDVDNLSLSDHRAEAVADALAQQYNIPRENLVTQGYGEQFLLVDTSEPERRNRRVVVRRVTPLLQSDAGAYASGDAR